MFRIMFRRKKHDEVKTQPIDINKLKEYIGQIEEEQARKQADGKEAEPPESGHVIEKLDFPIKAPMVTHNFGDILRYFKYNMSSGLMTATIEREVQRELANRHDFPTKLFFSLIALGIMIFLIFMGAMVFYQAGPGAGQAVAEGAKSAGGIAIPGLTA